MHLHSGHTLTKSCRKPYISCIIADLPTNFQRAPAGSRSYAARMSRQGFRVLAMQSSWNPQPQQQQQQLQQQQQQQATSRQAAPLARAPAYQAAPVFLELTQVVNKQVVTRTSGRSLGCISGAWLDPARGTLVSFDLDDRKPGSGPGPLGLNSPARAGNIPLSALRQIGDVVLVHDESGLYEQDLDGRLGFVNPVGLDVKTRTGEFLGKVRDLSFSPDSGVVSRITYDEFGLPFLPISFFDCYSVSIQDVLSIGRGDIIVYNDAKYRERKESNGLFAAIPSLLKSLNTPRSASPQFALPAASITSDVYRVGAGSSAASSSRYLPADYTYEQWQADLRRWEAETGMTYEQYLRSQPQQQQQQPAPRNALPPAQGTAQPSYQQAGPGYPTASNLYTQPLQLGFGPQQQQQQQQPQQPYEAQSLQQYGYQQKQLSQPAPQQQQQRYDARQGLLRQQYGAAAGPQQGMSTWGTNPAAAGENPYVASRYAAPATAGQPAAGSSTGSLSNPAAVPGIGSQRPLQQQQFKLTQQQQAQQQQPVAGPRPPAGPAPQEIQPGVGPRQPPQGQGAAGSTQRQPQGGQQPPPLGRPVDDWLVRETRPRVSGALADGVLPLGEEGAAAYNGVDGDKQQQQQVQQQEAV